MNMIDKIFDIKLEDGTWVKCKCTKWDDETRRFEPIAGGGFIDIDWMEYMDQASLGRIKEDRHANLESRHDIENTAKSIAAFTGENFNDAKGLAIAAIEKRIGLINAMTEAEFKALKAEGFEGSTEADNTGFTIDGFYFAGLSFSPGKPFEAAVTEVEGLLKRDIGFVQQITYAQYREAKAFRDYSVSGS